MTTTSTLSLSLFTTAAILLGASRPAVADPASTAAASTAPGQAAVASLVRPVHLGLVPLGGERELDVEALSLSLIGDRVGRFSGVQLAPALTQTLEDSRGLQLSGGVNLAGKDLRGAQVAGGFNLTEGTVRGLQLSGGANGAGTAVGMQLAPVNVAGDSVGLQLGVVNVASREARGVQLGVVNVASRSRGFSFGVINVAREHDGEAFGLLNFIGNGIHDVAVYSTDTMISNASVKLGSRHLYTSWSIGYQPGDELASGEGSRTLGADDRRLGLGLGVGYRFDLRAGRLRFLEIEATGMAVQSELDFSDDDVPLLTSARAIFGVELTRQVTLIAGVTENVTVGTGGRDLDLERGGLEKVYESGDTTVRLYPGLLLGLQL